MKQTIKLSEAQLRKVVEESVKKTLAEGFDPEAEKMQWLNRFEACSEELRKLKQEVWQENGNQNTPLLELAFNLYKLCSFAKTNFMGN